ncbi:ML domain-containing protein [Sergentomyia squamirostris]
MLKLTLLALLAIFPAVIFARVNHFECVNSHSAANRPPAPAWVEVEGCSGATCNVPNGRPTVLSAAFAPITSHTALHFWVTVWLLGIPIPIDQPEGLDDACILIEGGCPVNAGQGETVATMNFQQTSPLAGLSVRIEVDLRDSNTQQSVVCGGVQVTVTAAEE